MAGLCYGLHLSNEQEMQNRTSAQSNQCCCFRVMSHNMSE
jgi:hypothetical protein